MFVRPKVFLLVFLFCISTLVLGAEQPVSPPSIDQTIDLLFAAQTFDQVAI